MVYKYSIIAFKTKLMKLQSPLAKIVISPCQRISTALFTLEPDNIFLFVLYITHTNMATTQKKNKTPHSSMACRLSQNSSKSLLVNYAVFTLVRLIDICYFCSIFINNCYFSSIFINNC